MSTRPLFNVGKGDAVSVYRGHMIVCCCTEQNSAPKRVVSDFPLSGISAPPPPPLPPFQPQRNYLSLKTLSLFQFTWVAINEEALGFPDLLQHGTFQQCQHLILKQEDHILSLLAFQNSEKKKHCMRGKNPMLRVLLRQKMHPVCAKSSYMSSELGL